MKVQLRQLSDTKMSKTILMSIENILFLTVHELS